jgi:two-component system sensor histidine kinase LytS
MRDEGPLSIDIQVVTDGDDVLIAVADDGLGMTEDVADRLLERSSQDSSKSPKGTGIALRNVAERLRRFYGGNSNLEIMSKVGEGTVVTLRLANAAPKEHDARIE